MNHAERKGWLIQASEARETTSMDGLTVTCSGCQLESFVPCLKCHLKLSAPQLAASPSLHHQGQSPGSREAESLHRSENELLRKIRSKDLI